MPWPEVGRPRRAGVSSFGISGTNAHVIIEEAARGAWQIAVAERSLAMVPWVVSGRTEEALRAQVVRLRSHVDAHPELGLADIGLALATTRSPFAHRAVVVGADRTELLAGSVHCGWWRDWPGCRYAQVTRAEAGVSVHRSGFPAAGDGPGAVRGVSGVRPGL